jgi:uncharacterized protein (TIGR02996 family)
MTHDEAFLADILEHPDNDAPRLIYADWLEDQGQDDRATFIRIQIKRDRRGDDSGEGLALRDQAECLLRAHWDEWVRPLAALVGEEPGERWLRGGYHADSLARFRRGFVSFLELHAKRFVRHADELFRLAPISQLRLRRAADVARELAGCPGLRWLDGLEFNDYYSSPIDPEAMAHLAGSPHLERLRFLGAYNNHLGDRGAAHLARAPWLANLQVLDLGDNGLSERGVTALARSPRRFRPIRLRLGDNQPGVEGLAALGASPITARLAALGLDNCRIGPAEAAALAGAEGLTALRFLDLDDNPLGDEGAAHLARAGWLDRLAGLSLRGCLLSPAAESRLARRRHPVV